MNDSSIQLLGRIAQRPMSPAKLLAGWASAKRCPASQLEREFNAALAAMKTGGLVECIQTRDVIEVRITPLGRDWLRAAKARPRERRSS